jgi:hypothetical protein
LTEDQVVKERSKALVKKYKAQADEALMQVAALTEQLQGRAVPAPEAGPDGQDGGHDESAKNATTASAPEPENGSSGEGSLSEFKEKTRRLVRPRPAAPPPGPPEGCPVSLLMLGVSQRSSEKRDTVSLPSFPVMPPAGRVESPRVARGLRCAAAQ